MTMSNPLQRAAAALALVLGTGAMASPQVYPHLRLVAEERLSDIAVTSTGADRAFSARLTTKVTPRAGVALVDRTVDLRGWYAADVSWNHVSSRTSVDHRALADWRQDLSERLEVRGGARLWRVSDPTSLPRAGVARTLEPVLYGRATFGSTLRTTARTRLLADYVFEGARVGSGASGVGHTVEGAGLYALSRQVDAGPAYRAMWLSYGAESAVGHGPALRVEGRLDRATRAGAVVGATRHLAPSAAGWEPRVELSLRRDGEHVDLALGAGHDLVGASAYAAALWADFASASAAIRLRETIQLRLGASYFRNGRAAGQAAWFTPAGTADRTDGYRLGAVLDAGLSEQVRIQLAYDRISQVGELGAVGGLQQNLAALRLVVTPFVGRGQEEGSWTDG